MAHSGLDKERFVNLNFDNFDCLICCEIVVDPYECEICGKLFCKICIGDWIRKNPAVKCPNRCASQIIPVKSMALKKLYNNLDIRCSNPKCNKVVKLFDLFNHQETCLKIKCWNYDICQKIQNESIKSKKPCCSNICQILCQLQENYGNKKKMYQILGQVTNSKVKQPVVSSSSVDVLSWDTSKFGTGIIISDHNTHVFLKQQPYVFRSVMGNIGFTQGVNYWQIIADPRTQNQIKIGVTSSKDFDHNSAFCDHSFGYAYYGLGQLRHGSNATGPAYGKRFKKQGILGVCLNMNKGTLSFALNGDFMGVAFTDQRLKNGKYFPAVSLLHCAGCKVRGGIPVPSYFN